MRDDLPVALIDTEKIGRVLDNLLDNAIKYSPDNDVITLIAAVDEDLQCLVVSVTDRGQGIPAEARERVFECFAQVADQKPVRRGFRLGLTFCRLAVEVRGGHIWIEAGPDRCGGRFMFTPPLSG